MKKHILLLVVILLSEFNSHAQMTLAHTYVGWDPIVVNFTNYGKKYAILSDSATLKLYNINHTLWKTIALPVLPNYPVGYLYVTRFFLNGNFANSNSSLISDNLFNSDTLIEVIGHYFIPGTQNGVMVVVNENGVIVDSVSNVSYTHMANVKIQNTEPNKFVLAVPINTAINNQIETNIYNLPGTIPCETCGGPLAIQKTEEPQNFGTVSDPIPNPTSGNTKIEYMLPLYVQSGEIDMYDTEGRIVRKYKVTTANTSISIDASELSAGTYYYHLKAGESFTTAKKMLVIK